MTVRLNAKSNWRAVLIPDDFKSREEFEGLVDIQELTDYELIKNDSPRDDTVSGANRKKRRKKDEYDEFDEFDLECNDKPLKKKRKIESGWLVEDLFHKKDADTPVEVDTVKRKKKINNKKNKKIKTTKLDTQDSDIVVNQSNTNERNEEGTVLEKDESDISLWKSLHVPDVLLKSLQRQGFHKPTEIQMQALPSAIRDRKDILGAAETGSGKTLAFGIPVMSRILSSLKKRKITEEESEDNDGMNKVNHPLALILEPTRELAVQVLKHLQALAQFTNIKLANVVGGMSIEKQRRLLSKKPEIIIATPGRLWQLFEEGEEHVCQMDRVECLVVDEADRMVEKGHYEELTKLLEMINQSTRRNKRRQTFVMSATLTMDIAPPKRLSKKQKRKSGNDDKLKSLSEKICVGLKPKVIDLTPKDKVAQTLTELRVNARAEEKDFYLYYFLRQYPGRTLVFANSKDCLRRLISLFTLLKCNPLPLHADMHQRQRLKNLDRFADNSRGVLVASDVAARGLDIPDVDHVVHYQVPRTMENYVHRSGRTARASKGGLSVMLVGAEDAKDYRKIVQGVRNEEELPVMPVDEELMPAVRKRVELARRIDVEEHRLRKKRANNNFFIKTAQEMDMILDDEYSLLADMGDEESQATERQRLNSMKTSLEAMLRSSLGRLYKTKYPTKSGQLQINTAVQLF